MRASCFCYNCPRAVLRAVTGSCSVAVIHDSCYSRWAVTTFARVVTGSFSEKQPAPFLTADGPHHLAHAPRPCARPRPRLSGQQCQQSRARTARLGGDQIADTGCAWDQKLYGLTSSRLAGYSPAPQLRAARCAAGGAQARARACAYVESKPRYGRPAGDSHWVAEAGRSLGSLGMR